MAPPAPPDTPWSDLPPLGDLVLPVWGTRTRVWRNTRPYRPTPPTPEGCHPHTAPHTTIHALKHRLLVAIYRMCVRKAEDLGSRQPIREFHAMFSQLEQLRMMKMQLLDEDHLFIKYTSEDVVTLRTVEPSQHLCYFVLYRISTAEIGSVFHQSCPELVRLYESFLDHFRNARLPCEDRNMCSAANNAHAKSLAERFKATLLSSRVGGEAEANRRLLGLLPVACQAFSASPYLDVGLFQYHDKWLSVLERPKQAAPQPIRFYAREDSLRLLFSIDASSRPPPHPQHPQPYPNLVAFTFHPRDPLALSVQKSDGEYVLSVHLRHTPSSPPGIYRRLNTLSGLATQFCSDVGGPLPHS